MKSFVAILVFAFIAVAVFADEEPAKKEKRGLGYGLGYGGLYSASPLYSGYSSVSVHPSYYGSGYAYAASPYTYSTYPAYSKSYYGSYPYSYGNSYYGGYSAGYPLGYGSLLY